MCYRPLRILNPSSNFNSVTDKIYMTVPCGHCGQCRQKQIDEYQARVYYEYLDTVAVGGYALIQTFTYADEFVPWKFGIMCFSNSDYRLFTSNFRDEILRRGYSKGTVKHCFVCEYGGETYRPHYHGLFFVRDPKLTPEELCEIQEIAWSRFDSGFGAKRDENGRFHRTPLGFLDTNNPYSHKKHTPQDNVVNGQGAIAYVSKYVCKDFDFFSVINKQVNGNYSGPDYDKLTKEDKRDFFPFHRQSNGFGLCMKDYITKEELFDGCCSFPDKVLGRKVVALPQYIDRKVFYNYDKETKCFKLNDAGLSMKEHRDEYNLGSVKNQFIQIINNLDVVFTHQFASKYPDLNSPLAFEKRVGEIMNGRSFDSLAEYVYYYKDIVDYFGNENVTLSAARHMRLISRVGCSSGVSLREIAADPLRYSHIKFFDSHTYSYRPEFLGFEEVLTLFNDLNKFYCDSLQLAYKKKQRDKSHGKKIFNFLYNYKTF